MCEAHKPEKNKEIVMKFFFEAMQKGWASGVRFATSLEMHGWKEKLWSYGSPDINNGLTIQDRYQTFTYSRISHGCKTIFLNGRPIWYMVYGGWYAKEVIPFLKRTLLHNYTQNVFLGGRGPERLEGDDHTLQYLNCVGQNDFGDFKGHEYIIATSDQVGVPAGTKLGEHNYFGGLIL